MDWSLCVFGWRPVLGSTLLEFLGTGSPVRFTSSGWGGGFWLVSRLRVVFIVVELVGALGASLFVVPSSN